MDLLIPLVFIILLSIVYVAVQKNHNNRLLSLLSVLALVLLFCYVQMRNEFNTELTVSEGFFSRNMSPAPIGNVMGVCDNLSTTALDTIERSDRNYDGLRFKSGTKPDYKILPSDKVAYHSPVGDAYALNPDKAMSETYPSIDGNPDSPNHMFMMAYNRSSPECCPSTFSSSRGCVCMSDAQRDFINRRGSNKNVNGNPDF